MSEVPSPDQYSDFIAELWLAADETAGYSLARPVDPFRHTNIPPPYI